MALASQLQSACRATSQLLLGVQSLSSGKNCRAVRPSMQVQVLWVLLIVNSMPTALLSCLHSSEGLADSHGSPRS